MRKSIQLKNLAIAAGLLLLASSLSLAQVNVTLPDGQGSAGTTGALLPITVGDVTGQNITAFQGTLTFNSSFINITGVDGAGTLTASGWFTSYNPANGKIAGAAASPISGSGTLINLVVSFIADGTSALNSTDWKWNAGTPTATVTPGSVVTSVQIGNQIPTEFSLQQNFPNPFNPSTQIRFELPKEAAVTMNIYNVLGQPVRTLIANEMHQAGVYSTTWDGRNDAGASLSSGMYLYRIQAGDFVSMKKMTLVK